MININNYSVLLLSAGVARRMGNVTKNKPKSLLKVNGNSLLKRIIIILKKKKIKEISIVVGFKFEKIIRELKKVNGIKFNFIKINNYRSNGHACSWHAFKNHWLKTKKPIILMHTDIYFDEKYLDNILKSKKENIIGIHSNKRLFREDSIMVECTKKNKLKSLDYLKNNKSYYGEILGINKISKKTSSNIFLFMDRFLLKDKKKLSWEFMLNFFLKKNKDQFYVLNKQNYIWKNINYLKDYNYLIKKFKKHKKLSSK
jgi:choline kinase